MRSTNERRLAVCTLAATGREEEVTLRMLSRRVAQVHVGRTRVDRQIRRMLPETSKHVEALALAVDASLASIRAETRARLELNPPNASGLSATDCGGLS